MSRSCGLLKWEKGKSYSKFLDKLANGNCHSVYLQLPFGLPAIAIRSTGKCHSVYLQLPFGLPANAVRSTGKCRSVISNGARDDFIQGTYRNRPFEMFQKQRDIQSIGGADGE